MRAMLTLLLICALSFSASADKSKKSHKSKKSDKASKELTVDIVQISYTTTLDDGSVVPLASPVVFVAGRNFGDENKLTVTLANILVVVDADDDNQDNLFSFVLSETFLDESGVPRAGDYLLQAFRGKSHKSSKSATKQASHLLTIDPGASGLSIALAEEIALREAADQAEVFARSSTDSELGARLDANKIRIAGAQLSANDALTEAVAAQAVATDNVAAIAVIQSAATEAQSTAALGVTNAATAQLSSQLAQTTADIGVTNAAAAQNSADNAIAAAQQALAEIAVIELTPGPQGAKGDVGAIGLQGTQGEVGATGPQGVQGIEGRTGEVGPQGDQGITGAIGLTGPQGAQGIPGEIGAVGPQGDQGITGAIGLTGPQGAQGVPGEVGAVGPQGQIGNTGPAGIQGPRGLMGPAGQEGPVADIGAINIVIEACVTGDWLESFDREGWSFCPDTHPLMTGLYRSGGGSLGGQSLFRLEYARCCSLTVQGP